MTKTKALSIINLMPEHEMAMASPGYRSEVVRIQWDLQKDMYPLPGKKPIGPNGTWVKVYAPKRTGLDRLQIAGGISTDVSRTGAERVEELVWAGRWGGTYTTPAGIQIDLYDEYEFDVRPGIGARWHERVFQEYSGMLAERTNARSLRADGVIAVEATLTEEEKDDYKAKAEAKATRWCLQVAQFGRQRAITGARLRALRTYFNISTYTEQEVKGSYFVIQRTRVDHDLLEKQLGKTGAQLLMFAETAKKMGLGTDEINTLSKLMLESGQAQTIDGQVVQRGPFDKALSFETFSEMKRTCENVFGRNDISDGELGAFLAKVFADNKFNDAINWRGLASEGEALIAIEYFERLKDYADKEPRTDEELTEARRDLASIARECVAERVLWGDREEPTDPQADAGQDQDVAE